MSRNTRKYPPEVRERAVVLEHEGEHRSQWGAMEVIAPMFGMATETRRIWVRQAVRDRGLKLGPKSEELVRALRRALAVHSERWEEKGPSRRNRAPTSPGVS